MKDLGEVAKGFTTLLFVALCALVSIACVLKVAVSLFRWVAS